MDLKLDTPKATLWVATFTLFMVLAVLVFGVVQTNRAAKHAVDLNGQVLDAIGNNIHDHRLRNEESHSEIVTYIKCILLLPQETGGARTAAHLESCQQGLFTPPETPKPIPRPTPRGLFRR